jgi:hypothetical protein
MATKLQKYRLVYQFTQRGVKPFGVNPEAFQEKLFTSKDAWEPSKYIKALVDLHKENNQELVFYYIDNITNKNNEHRVVTFTNYFI